MTTEELNKKAEELYPFFKYADEAFNLVVANQRIAYADGHNSRNEEVATLREALENIAKQRTYEECMADEEFGGGDFEGAYSHIIILARNAL